MQLRPSGEKRPVCRTLELQVLLASYPGEGSCDP